jgi:hypothetical protein
VWGDARDVRDPHFGDGFFLRLLQERPAQISGQNQVNQQRDRKRGD